MAGETTHEEIERAIAAGHKGGVASLWLSLGRHRAQHQALHLIREIYVGGLNLRETDHAIIRYDKNNRRYSTHHMSLAPPLNQLDTDLSPAQQRDLQQGEVLLIGSEGDYTVLSLVQATPDTVWSVLTNYEQFPEFLPSVVASRVLERRDNRVLVERKDRRKIGFMPIRVKIVTENIENSRDRVIDYRMVDGTLDEMTGTWELTSVPSDDGAEQTLLAQKITARASMGPLQPYFYDVFESGLKEMTTDLRAEMQRQHGAQQPV